MELVVVVVGAAVVEEEEEGRVAGVEVPNAEEPPKGEEAPPKMEDVVAAVAAVAVVVGAVAVEVDAGFAPPKDGAADDGAPPKIDPDGFEGAAPKTEPDDVAAVAAAVEDAPKMPLVGVAVGDVAGFDEAAVAVGVPKRDPVVLGAAAAGATAAGDEEVVATGVGNRAVLLVVDSGFWLAVNDAAENDDIVVAVCGGLGTFPVVVGTVLLGAAGDPKLKDPFASAAVPKLKPEVAEVPPPEGFVVDPSPNPENEDCGGGGLGAATVDEGGTGAGFVAGVADDANANDPPEDIGFGGAAEDAIGVTVTLPRLKGFVIVGGKEMLA